MLSFTYLHGTPNTNDLFSEMIWLVRF